MNAIHEAASLRQETDAIKVEWAQGVEPNALQALARRPELREHKSLVLELAYEEYCLRFEAGAPPDVEAFCNRFPSFRRSLRSLVAGHQMMVEHVDQLLEVGPTRWPAEGEKLGDLTLLREMGRGAFAHVYLAFEDATNRAVVVKLSPEGAAEARTMGRLHHPHVAPILSARWEASVGLTAVVMPYQGAATLDDVFDRAYPTPDIKPPFQAEVIYKAARAAIRPGDPAPQESFGALSKPKYDLYTDATASLALQIAEALTFLHKEGVCHRDLKPSNVLLSPEGQVLLLDFNLSADARAAVARLGGTLPYMPPEQVDALMRDDKEAAMDGRGDLFALGVILYELLSGQHPFGTLPSGLPTAATAATLVDRQRGGAVPLRTLNPAVDRRLARLIESCLAFDPAGRPASAAVLAAALRRYLSLPGRLWRAAVRRPWTPAAAAGLLLLAAGGAAGELASQPPMEMREYRQGQEAYAEGDFAHAEEWFGKALEHSPQTPKPRKYYLARAAALMWLGDVNGDHTRFSLADQDLDEANKQASDGATLVCIGYCSSRLNQHAVAVEWYTKAIDAGCQSAALYNDRGLSYLQQGRFDSANEDFDKALGIEPALSPALYNRGLASLQNRASLPAPGPIPESTIDGMQRVVDSSPPARQMYLDVAQLCAVAVQEGHCVNPAARTSQALDYLQKAVECGHTAQLLGRDPVFHVVLSADPQFQLLLSTPPRPLLNPAPPQWVDPAPRALE